MENGEVTSGLCLAGIHKKDRKPCLWKGLGILHKDLCKLSGAFRGQGFAAKSKKLCTGELTALEAAYRTVYLGALIFLALMIFLCLIRAVKGPSIADRIVAVNMMGTMVMVIIAILALMLKEGYLVDICLIYAMISFLAVVVLTKVYMGVYSEKQHSKRGERNGSV